MGKSEKFYHVYPVLFIFMQVAGCVSVCGYLSRCSVNFLKNTGCWVNCSSCCCGKILSGIGWVQQNFVACLFCFQEKLMGFSITNFWGFFFSFYVIAMWDMWALPLQGELMRL